MKVITTYIAFDGEEFANEKDCLKHEAEMCEGTDKVMFYTQDMKPIKDVFGEGMSDTYFIIINAFEDIKIVERIFDYHDLSTPWIYSDVPCLAGLYYWSDKDEEWHHWQTEMKFLSTIGNYFQQFEEENEEVEKKRYYCEFYHDNSDASETIAIWATTEEEATLGAWEELENMVDDPNDWSLEEVIENS